MRKISPILKEKLNKQEYSKYQETAPKVEVTIARARSSIQDTNYFNIETIREKEGIGEVSVAIQRLVPYGRPTGIYEIHIDNGIAKTSKRAYPDRYEEGFINQFQIGPAKSVAIAFDGRWELNQRNQWNIKTFHKPYIFWVEEDGKLFTQLWDEEETRKVLSENVEKVDAIRGWKSTSILIKDQGLIAGYIKNNGKVHYRNYCEQEDNRFKWEDEREIQEFTGMAENINLFITNDYRMGLMVEDNNQKIYWFITTRDWAGLAIRPEKIYIKAHIDIDFIKVRGRNAVFQERIIARATLTMKLKYASTYNEFIEAANIEDDEGDWGHLIQFRTKHKLFDFTVNDFEIIESNGISYRPIQIEEISGVFTLTFDNFNNFKGEILLRAKGIGLKNEAGYVYDSFEISFIPNNLVPTELTIPELELIWNE